MDKIFQALSSSTRRKILAFLSKAGMTAGEISDRFDMSKPALSKHLDILKNAGLVESEKKGQFVHYSLVRENLANSLYDFVGSICPGAYPYRRDSAKKAKDKNKDKNKDG